MSTATIMPRRGTATRGIQAQDQEADRAAVRRYSGHVFWALLAPGQINMRKVDAWQSPPASPIDHPIDLATSRLIIGYPQTPPRESPPRTCRRPATHSGSEFK